MKKNFTRFFALVVSVVMPAMAMAELAYNVPFSEEDWNDETTIVAGKGNNEWSSEHGICLGNNGLGGFDYSDKYVVIALASNATPMRLTATTKTRDTWGWNSGATDVFFSVSTSSDNENFAEVWTSESKKNDIDVALPADTRYVKVLYSGNFAGCVEALTVYGETVETGVEDLVAPKNPAVKVMKNGQMYIVKDNQMYDCLGRMVE
jgi:hypothetical protein